MGGGRSRPRELQGSDAENENEGAKKEGVHAADRAPHGGAAARERAADRNRSKEGNGGEARKKVNYPKEVLFHAKQLGLNPDKDDKLMWIAEKAANDRILPPWGKFRDKNGRIYYSNAATKQTIWQSPYMDEYHKLIKQSRKEIVQVDPLKQDEAFQRAPSTKSAHEKYYVLSENKLACIVPDLHSKVSQLHDFPDSWSINRIKVQGSAGLRGRKVKWYYANLRCCQIPFVSACFDLKDFDAESDPRLGEKLNDGSQYNGHTILSLDLSVNNISMLSNGGLAAFIHLRKLDLSCNCISHLDGLGAVPNAVEVNLSYNRLGHDTDISNCFSGNRESILSYGGLEKLKSLRILNLSYNYLKQVSDVFSMSSLTDLRLDANQLETLAGLERLPSLQVLSARQNLLRELSTTKSSNSGSLQQDDKTVRYHRAHLSNRLLLIDLETNKFSHLEQILEPLSTCTSSLTELNLIENDLQGDSMLHQATVLNSFPSLTKLDGRQILV
mmetsp:Transcript_42768/g.134775  ORF Transcript_42768/g.134775 Transcript_42768/m.134775 type:complete len:499 (-) Transcript_42768:535-2031(-)